MRMTAWLLSCLLALPASLLAQSASRLRIIVIQGEGAINNISIGSGREPVVEVRDGEDRPLAGAKVTFTLPDTGPGGTFFDASRRVTVATNEQGRAAGAGFRPNSQQGRFQILVGVAAGDQTAAAVITQSNALPGGSVNRVGGNKKGFGAGKIIAIIAVAAIAAAIGATRGDEDTPVAATVTGTTITPGTVAVGIPR